MSSIPKRVPPSRVSRSHILDAATALLKHIHEKREELRLKDLLDEGEDIQLGITFQKAGTKKSTKPTLFSLPHPFNSSSREICLIIRDDDNLKSDLKDLNLQGVRKIMQFKKIKILSALYEERTKFCDSYDLFIADDIVYPLAKARLGKHFWRTKKMPVPVDLSKGSIKKLKDQIEKINRSAIFYLPSSSFVAVKIGNTSQSPQDITENIVSIMDDIIMKMDPINGWDIIQNLTIKTHDSLAFPFFNQIPLGPTSVPLPLSTRLTSKTNKKVAKTKNQNQKRTPKLITKSELTAKAKANLQKSKKRKVVETEKKEKTQKTEKIEKEKVETPTKTEKTEKKKVETPRKGVESKTPTKTEKKVDAKINKTPTQTEKKELKKTDSTPEPIPKKARK